MAERLPPTRTPIDPEALRASLAKALGVDVSADSVSLLLAHVALETGWRSCVAWNLGNVKAGADVDHTYFTTWEEFTSEAAALASSHASPDTRSAPIATVDGRRWKIVYRPDDPACRFRAFRSLDDGAAFYLHTLQHGRYAPAWPSVLAGDVAGFCHVLRAHGYYTASEDSYRAGMLSRYEELAWPALSTPAAVAKTLQGFGFADVRAFQTAKGLTPDGIVGPATRAAIRALL